MRQPRRLGMHSPNSARLQPHRLASSTAASAASAGGTSGDLLEFYWGHVNRDENLGEELGRFTENTRATSAALTGSQQPSTQAARALSDGYSAAKGMRFSAGRALLVGVRVAPGTFPLGVFLKRRGKTVGSGDARWR